MSRIVLLALALLGAPAFATGCLVEYQLDSVEAVHITVETAALGFGDAIPNLDWEALGAKIATLAPAILEKRSVRVHEHSPLELAINVRHSREPANPGWVALAVTLDLSEPVALSRSLPASVSGPLTAVSWHDDTLDLVRVSEAESEILASATYLLETFGDDVQQARSTFSSDPH